MYITTDLIIKIAFIALSVLHILFDIWVLVKLRGCKSGGGSLTIGELFNNVKKVASSFITYIEPKFPNIIGLVKAITGTDKTGEKDEKEQENNG